MNIIIIDHVPANYNKLIRVRLLTVFKVKLEKICRLFFLMCLLICFLLLQIVICVIYNNYTGYLKIVI